MCQATSYHATIVTVFCPKCEKARPYVEFDVEDDNDEKPKCKVCGTELHVVREFFIGLVCPVCKKPMVEGVLRCYFCQEKYPEELKKKITLAWKMLYSIDVSALMPMKTSGGNQRKSA